MKLRYLVGLPIAIVMMTVGATAIVSAFIFGIRVIPCDWRTCYVAYGEIGRVAVIAGGPFAGYDPFLTGLFGGFFSLIFGSALLGVVFERQLTPIVHNSLRTTRKFISNLASKW